MQIRLYPEYFDKGVSRRQGRRLSNQLALKDPSLVELKIAPQKLGYIVETHEGAHPAHAIKRHGMLLLKPPEENPNPMNKDKLVKRISQLVVSYARPAIEQKKKELAEEKKLQKPGQPSKPLSNIIQKPSNTKSSRPVPRRR